MWVYSSGDKACKESGGMNTREHKRCSDKLFPQKNHLKIAKKLLITTLDKQVRVNYCRDECTKVRGQEKYVCQHRQRRRSYVPYSRKQISCKKLRELVLSLDFSYFVAECTTTLF